MRRKKEIGVRKVLGAHKHSIRVQFLAETYAHALVSLILALILAEIFIPSVNRFFGDSLNLSLYASEYLVPFVFILFLSIGLLSWFFSGSVYV